MNLVLLGGYVHNKAQHVGFIPSAPFHITESADHKFGRGIKCTIEFYTIGMYWRIFCIAIPFIVPFRGRLYSHENWSPYDILKLPEIELLIQNGLL